MGMESHLVIEYGKVVNIVLWDPEQHPEFDNETQHLLRVSETVVQVPTGVEVDPDDPEGTDMPEFTDEIHYEVYDLRNDITFASDVTPCIGLSYGPGKFITEE